MATLFNSSSFLSFSSSHKHFFFHHQLNLNPQEHPLRKHFTFTSSASSPYKSSRSSRKVKGNEELCNDIREFLSTVGLPYDHVPTVKDLSEHGRNDLANIVRRRGYKFIRELLASSTKTDFDRFTAENGLAGQDEKVNNEVEDVSLSDEQTCARNYFGSTNTDSDLHPDNHSWMPMETSALSALEEEGSYILNGQNENADNIIEDASISSNAYAIENHSSGPFTNEDLISDETTLLPMESSSGSCSEEIGSFKLEAQHNKTDSMAENISVSTDISVMENYSSASNFKPSHNFVEHGCTPQEDSATTTLEEKVAKFIQNGELDMIEDNVYGTVNESDANESKEAEDTIENKSGGYGHLEHSFNDRVDGTLNGSALTSKQIATSATENHPLRDDTSAAEVLRNADFDKDFDVETSRGENQLEINHLKFMLHQKGLELAWLKEQIEKEKHALSVLQTKAETEISKAKNLISEKDAELQAVEECLSGLEEVWIQYSGDGEMVELAGSFNGWHHRVKMDPQPSSSIIEPIGPRKSRLWSTVLWLYPGIYEIKFIVDGQWRIDPQRESVTKGGILNNILRVDR